MSHGVREAGRRPPPAWAPTRDPRVRGGPRLGPPLVTRPPPQVKVWNTLSGFCFVTFTEHSSGVTGVTFTATGYVIVTSSMDGTVRAFDLHR